MDFWSHVALGTEHRIELAITFFVQPESKASIRAALADGGYGTSFQQGIVNLLNELMVKQNREPIT